jgi:hypothetical protein
MEFSFIWRDEFGTFISDEPIFTVNQDGIYSLQIIDYSTGCSAPLDNFTVSEIGAPEITVQVMGNMITGTVDGLGEYEFSINGDDWFSSGIFTGLSIGEYTLCTRDITGCGQSCATVNVNREEFIIDCIEDQSVNINYCYSNNDNISWIFTSTSGYPLEIYFNAGTNEGGFDNLTIYNGNDNSGSIIFNSDLQNIEDFTGVVIESTSTSVYVEVNSDGSGSCDSSGYTPWDFDVYCKTYRNFLWKRT